MVASVDRVGAALKALLPGDYSPAAASQLTRIAGAAECFAWQRAIADGGPVAPDGQPRLLFGGYQFHSIETALAMQRTLNVRGGWPATWVPMMSVGSPPEHVIAVDTASTAVHAWTRGHTWRVTATLEQWSETVADVLEPLVAEQATSDDGWDDLWHSDAVLAAIDETLALRGTPVVPPTIAAVRTPAVDDMTHARVQRFAGAARRFAGGLYVPATDVAQLGNARWPAVPTELLALYFEVSDGDPVDGRWYGLGNRVHVFDDYRWLRAGELASSASDFDDASRHPAWRSSWVPWLASDSEVVAVEATPAGAVWRYAFKERGASRVADSLGQWLAAATTVIGELANESQPHGRWERPLGSPSLMRRIESRLGSS